MAYELPPLTYAYNALEPWIDELTMTIHHDKHHAAYVANLNKALESTPEWQNKPLEELLSNLDKLPESIRTAVRNNGGGVYNHNMFWEIMGPALQGSEEELTEKISKLAQNAFNMAGAWVAVVSAFGSLKSMIEQVNNAGMTRFGSGWAWVVMDKDGKLSVMSTANQDNPLSEGLKPILTVDVWEHAYYLRYQNRRADYLKAWWNVVNWEAVADRYKMYKG